SFAYEKKHLISFELKGYTFLLFRGALALVLAMSAGRYRKSEAKAVIKETDMLEELQQQAANCAYEALQHHQQYMDIARYVRKRFDDLYGPSWSCVVGADFGASFAYEKKHLISFQMKGKTFLLFRGA
uniref:Dynein light chain n=1 Tax=Echinococcus canadensis TaxID=519352 RepID=A0A915ETU2_9CEST